MSHKKILKKIDLHQISSPDFVRELNNDELKLLSADLKDEILKDVAENGGHLSSNLGVIDATVALCHTFDFNKDKIIFDVGHQCYAYKILTGRDLSRLRNSDGVSGFQRMSESKYDHFEAGHSSTSIAVANGLAIARDLKKEKYDVIAFIGDSSITNGLALESLNDVSAQQHKVIIVLNDNEMSISKPVGGISKLFRRFSTSNIYRKSRNFYRRIMSWTFVGRWIYKISTKFKNWFKIHVLRINIFDTMQYSYIGPVDGHDIKALNKAFERAKKADKSIVVHIKTVKGKGYEPSEKDLSGKWHGVPPFKIEDGDLPSEMSFKLWQYQIANELDGFMERHENVLTIVPATGFGSYLEIIKEKYNKRFFDVGIAEEYAFTLSGALSSANYHPVISIYSTFMQRAYDEISHDIARINLNATILIDRAGLVGKDGSTHQGIYDEQFMYGIPNTVITMPLHSGQIASLLEESYNKHGVFAIRYPKDKCQLLEKEEVPFASWKKLLNGTKTAIVSVGPDTLLLKEKIKELKLDVSLYGAIYLKPLDASKVKELLNYSKIIVFDAYGVENGFPAILAKELLLRGYQGELLIRAIPDEFIHHASISEQKKLLHVDIDSVISEIK